MTDTPRALLWVHLSGLEHRWWLLLDSLCAETGETAIRQAEMCEQLRVQPRSLRRMTKALVDAGALDLRRDGSHTWVYSTLPKCKRLGRDRTVSAPSEGLTGHPHATQTGRSASPQPDRDRTVSVPPAPVTGRSPPPQGVVTGHPAPPQAHLTGRSASPHLRESDTVDHRDSSGAAAALPPCSDSPLPGWTDLGAGLRRHEAEVSALRREPGQLAAIQQAFADRQMHLDGEPLRWAERLAKDNGGIGIVVEVLAAKRDSERAAGRPWQTSKWLKSKFFEIASDEYSQAKNAANESTFESMLRPGQQVY